MPTVLYPHQVSFMSPVLMVQDMRPTLGAGEGESQREGGDEYQEFEELRDLEELKELIREKEDEYSEQRVWAKL